MCLCFDSDMRSDMEFFPLITSHGYSKVTDFGAFHISDFE